MKSLIVLQFSKSAGLRSNSNSSLNFIKRSIVSMLSILRSSTSDASGVSCSGLRASISTISALALVSILFNISIFSLVHLSYFR